MNDYQKYIKLNGISLNNTNHGSNEVALVADKAIKAIELIKKENTPILGGDILTYNNGSILYAYLVWGSQYHCLNWYCNKTEKESKIRYAERSYGIAKRAIKESIKIAKILDEDCLITFII